MKAKRGFTVIELIAVIAIIGILATIGYPFIAKAMAKAKAAQLASQLRELRVGLAKYYKDMGTFPYYLDFLIRKPTASDKQGWDAFTVATTGQPGTDDPDLKDYWGGPYIDGMKMSPDVQHCLQSTLGTPICFGAELSGDSNTSEVFANPKGQVINYPFSSGSTATIQNGKKSHGADSSSDAYYNVLQIAGVPKDIASYLYRDMNGGRAPLPGGNLIQAALGSADGGDPSMFIGMPALDKYSQYNRVIYRYFRLY